MSEAFLDDVNHIDWVDFEQYVKSKYAPSSSKNIIAYCKKYWGCLIWTKDILTHKETDRGNIIKALIVLTKYLGRADEFKTILKAYDIKPTKTSAIGTFLRMYNSSKNENLVDWEFKSKAIVKPNEQLFLRYCKLSGLRADEAINSFNLIISLSKQNKLDEYFDKDYTCLCHFKYEKLFLRKTKNTYITFIDEKLLAEISNSEPVTYASIRKRLTEQHIPMKLNVYRKMFGSYLIQHGILLPEIDCVQGRVSASVFIQYYWRPSLKELGTKILKALEELN